MGETISKSRATRATELVAAGWPEYKVCKWLGHTEAVAKKHYWQVTDDDYAAAAGVDGKALQNLLQISDARPCFPMREGKTTIGQNPAISRENTGFPDGALNSVPVPGVNVGHERSRNPSGNRGAAPTRLQFALQILGSLPDEQRAKILAALQGNQVVE